MAAFDPADFTTEIDNPFQPMAPGTTFVYRSTDGAVLQKFHVTRNTNVVDGVTCVVIHDVEYEDGELLEETFDYFAQNVTTGDVWYFGELATLYEPGGGVNHDGSWKSGVDGATAGIVMLADPDVGDAYAQENAPGIAEDEARVVAIGKSVSVPYGAFDDAIRIRETTPLAPDDIAFKFYVAGVGQVLTRTPDDPNEEFLTKILFRGTAAADNLFDTAGKDVFTGGAGGDDFAFDHLANGLRSNDTIDDYSLAEVDRIVLPGGDDSIAGEKQVEGVWRLVLAGDHDVVVLRGVTDAGGDGSILDDIEVVSAADAFAA